MKILFIADVPCNDPTSGSEQVLYQQANHLAGRGHEVYAITRQTELSSTTINKNEAGVTEGTYGVSTEQPVIFFKTIFKQPASILNTLPVDPPFDVCVSHQPFNCFALLASRKVKLPMLYVFHSPSHEEYLLMHDNGNSIKNSVNSLGRRLVERHCVRRARKVMVLSEFMKQKVLSIHGIPDSLVTINPGGVDLERFQPLQNRAAMKETLDLPKNKIHLLTVRNLDSRMGLDNLIMSMKLLQGKNIPVHLTLGGEGEERNNLQNIIARENLHHCVTMTGFIPSETLPHYYGAADFFVIPTKFLEGFGLVTPESLATGTPVLGTPVGGTKEILSQFDAGFLFQDVSPEAMAKGIEQAITKHFGTPGKYTALRERCRHFACKKYSWQRHIDQLESMLTTITR